MPDNKKKAKKRVFSGKSGGKSKRTIPKKAGAGAKANTGGVGAGTNVKVSLPPSLVVNSGPPEIKKNFAVRNGLFYIDDEVLDIYVYAGGLGWIQLNGWCPDAGEGKPTEENPPAPMTGDQYIDLLTGDLYHFAEGFGWILFTGREGPPGSPGSSGFSEVLYATAKGGQKLDGESGTFEPIVWNVAQFQDPDYKLSDLELVIKNPKNDDVRYKVEYRVTVNSGLKAGSSEFRLMLGDQEVAGGSACGYHTFGSKMTVCGGAVIELHGEEEKKLRLLGRGGLGVSDGSLTVLRLG